MTWNRARPWLIVPHRLTALHEIKIPSSFCLKYLTFRNSSGFQSNPTETIRKIMYQLEFLCAFVLRILPRAVCHQYAEEMEPWVGVGGLLKGWRAPGGHSSGTGRAGHHKGWEMEVEMCLQPWPSYKEHTSKQCGEVEIHCLGFRASSPAKCPVLSMFHSPSSPSICNEEYSLFKEFQGSFQLRYFGK